MEASPDYPAQGSLRWPIRQKWLSNHTPDCFECESPHVQLTAYFESPACWQCQSCRIRFKYEPRPNSFVEWTFDLPPSYAALEHFIHAIKPRTYLEVGVSSGDSAARVYQKAISIGSPLDLMVLVDPWNHTYGGTSSQEEVLSRMEQLMEPGSKTTLTTVKGLSQALLPNFTSGTFDLIYIDGDHSLKGAMDDVREGIRLLTDGGVLVFDDLIHPAHAADFVTLRQELQRDPVIEIIAINDWQPNGCLVLKRA